MMLPANPAETQVFQCNTREKFLDHQRSKPRFQLSIGMGPNRDAPLLFEELATTATEE